MVRQGRNVVLSSQFWVRGSGFEACLAEGEGERRPETGDRRSENGENLYERGCLQAKFDVWSCARAWPKAREIGDRRSETGENLYERGSLLARFDVHCWTVAESRHRRESQSSRFDVWHSRFSLESFSLASCVLCLLILCPNLCGLCVFVGNETDL